MTFKLFHVFFSLIIIIIIISNKTKHNKFIIYIIHLRYDCSTSYFVLNSHKIHTGKKYNKILAGI